MLVGTDIGGSVLCEVVYAVSRRTGVNLIRSTSPTLLSFFLLPVTFNFPPRFCARSTIALTMVVKYRQEPNEKEKWRGRGDHQKTSEEG